MKECWVVLKANQILCVTDTKELAYEKLKEAIKAGYEKKEMTTAFYYERLAALKEKYDNCQGFAFWCDGYIAGSTKYLEENIDGEERLQKNK